MTQLHLATTLAAFLCLTYGASGSGIHFRSSSSSITPLVSQNLTLRCSLNDTSPSPGSPAAVVGRRSVTSLGHRTPGYDVMEANPTKKDSVRSVTSTRDNIMLITSMIISRDGKDLATLSEHFPAKPVGGATDYHVTGQLTPAASEKGFLELVWPRPTSQDAGDFRCEVNTLNTVGHAVDFSQTLTMTESEVTIADLVVSLGDLQGEIHDLKMANHRLNQENVGMNRTIDFMIHTNSKMNHTNTAMNNEILKLKSEKLPNVFFFAIKTNGSTSISSGQDVVYNEATVNEGGAYNASTGTFTSPVSGFYYFEMTAVTSSGGSVHMSLMKNGNLVTMAWSGGPSHTSATNSAIVKMVQGDKVHVVSEYGMHLYTLSRKDATFTGRLIAFA